MPNTTGNQIRTCICACGWIYRAQLREANNRFKIHKKFCKEFPENKPIIEAFNNKAIELHGTKMKNGNHGMVSHT